MPPISPTPRTTRSVSTSSAIGWRVAHEGNAPAGVGEADSILIDEARVPLVIAGGESGDRGAAYVADQIVRGLRPGEHFTVDPGGHNVALNDVGIHAVESALGCGNLFDNRNLAIHGAVEEALHAHALLRRDVDYIVKEGAIEMVDEFKGRIALDRRWPAGLHTALETKEGVAAKSQGMILGQITLQHLVVLYQMVCGMTGTAATTYPPESPPSGPRSMIQSAVFSTSILCSMIKTVD